MYCNLIKHTAVVTVFIIFAGLKVGEILGQVHVNDDNGHAYELVRVKMSWHAAKVDAESKSPPDSRFGQGHLVTFSDADEENFVLSVFGDTLNGAWIGFTDETTEGEWSWVDSTEGYWQDPNNFPDPTQTAHTNWRPSTNEPNNEFGNEDYAVYSLFMAPGPQWNDLPNDAGSFDSYVVEYEPISSVGIQSESAHHLQGGTIDQNFPNPFRSSTTIVFTVPETDFVTIEVVDSLGRVVKVLLAEQVEGGRHLVQFDATGLPSGIYICRLKTEQHSDTRLLTLLK